MVLCGIGLGSQRGANIKCSLYDCVAYSGSEAAGLAGDSLRQPPRRRPECSAAELRELSRRTASPTLSAPLPVVTIACTTTTSPHPASASSPPSRPGAPLPPLLRATSFLRRCLNRAPCLQAARKPAPVSPSPPQPPGIPIHPASISQPFSIHSRFGLFRFMASSA